MGICSQTSHPAWPTTLKTPLFFNKMTTFTNIWFLSSQTKAWANRGHAWATSADMSDPPLTSPCGPKLGPKLPSGVSWRLLARSSSGRSPSCLFLATFFSTFRATCIRFGGALCLRLGPFLRTVFGRHFRFHFLVPFPALVLLICVAWVQNRVRLVDLFSGSKNFTFCQPAFVHTCARSLRSPLHWSLYRSHFQARPAVCSSRFSSRAAERTRHGSVVSGGRSTS